MRQDVYTYVETKYRSRIEYLWKRYPNYAVFRHQDNQKWYCLIMDIPRNKLGLSGDDYVDILNVKLSDPFLVDMLVQQDGYFRGYHISRGNWISILLDGTVSFDEICRWIDESYSVTASRRVKKAIRPAKEWIVPANPKYYDVEHAFDKTDVIDWKQGRGIKVGDTVFLYVAVPVSAILYKCRVIETDIPYDYHDGSLTITALMRIKLQKKYKPADFKFEKLRDEYGIFAIRGPRGIPNSLSEALKK